VTRRIAAGVTQPAMHRVMHSTLHLPAAYVREHVELGYATTVHRAQGMTADAAHVLITPGMTRQALYVAMTRGRTANQAYITTDEIDPACPDPVDGGDAPNGRQVLQKVLATDGGELSATATLRQRYTEATALSHLVPIRTTLAAAASRERWQRLLTSTGLDPARVTELNRSPAAGVPYALLDDVADPGHNVTEVAVGTARGDVAAVITSIRGCVDDARPAASDDDAPTGQGWADPRYATALNEIDRLIRQRVHDARRHVAHDQCDRPAAIRIAEASQHSAPGHEGVSPR
jgi:hypothetical protein